ncbi:hypothetical protein JHK82_031844 [Glycine max]|nr:hypothetical protein JHK85_032503 [Glycine max]KAG4995110.1 hypothetical protein JHK86_031937 [Glycine max]KAG5125107.1 hypothetical protein JHK82_031844 [Glycine max]KAG5146535.1 hypothetical protein JHK84_032078 [Glycine max]
MSEELDQSLNIYSSYYMHPSESPTTTLVSPQLDPKNYSSWSKSMLITLTAKNKVKFVNGSISKLAATRALFSAWKICNNMVVSWLVHSVSTSIRQIILWMDNVVDIWKDLKARYSF